jgi:hypothetical protein
MSPRSCPVQSPQQEALKEHFVVALYGMKDEVATLS